MSARVKAEVVIPKVEDEPLEPNCVGEGEGRSSYRQCGGRAPRAEPARAKAEVVVAEVEGESLEPNCVIEAEGRS